MFAAALLLALALPQADVTRFLAGSSPTSGVFAKSSNDGARLFHGHGGRVYELDLARIRDWELSGAEAPDVADAWLREIRLEVSITALLEVGDTLVVGGGDVGVYRIVGGAPVLVDGDLDGRWCFDLAHDAERGELHALLGARDASELRTYDATTFELERTVRLDRTTGLPRESVAWALALADGHAYVAAGAAGLVRVTPEGDVERGLDFVPDGVTAREEAALHRARDVAVVGRRLVVAADSAGLVELDLDAPFEPGMPRRHHRRRGHYPVRVEALVDPSTGVHVVAVGTAPAPSAAHEWGPYYAYSGFDPLLRPPGVTDLGWWRGCGTALVVLEGAPGAPLAEALFHSVEGGPGKRSWKSLDLTFADERFWVLDNEFTVYSFTRDATGRLHNLLHAANRRYAATDTSYVTGIVSRLDPNLLLLGEDDAHGMGFYRVEGTNDAPLLAPVVGTEHKRFNTGLLLNGQWVSKRTGREWFASGTGQSLWRVTEFAASKDDPTQLVKTGAGEWKSHYLAFPDDPQLGRMAGWSYGSVAVDERGSLFAASRSHAPTPITLFRTADIEDAVANLGSKRSGRNRPLAVDPVGNISLHPSLELPVEQDAMDALHCLGMRFFEWKHGGREHTVLAVAAGVEVAGQNLGRPKVAFVYLEDAHAEGRTVFATDAPPAAVFQLDAPASPSTHTMAYGDGADVLMFDLEVVELGGKQYAFAGDSSGAIAAFELTGLFSGADLEPVARWRMSPSRLDGLPLPITALRARFEGEGEERALFLYLAANRRGVVKLRVTEENGAIAIAHERTVNTPSQVTGLVFGAFDLGGPEPLEAMVVFDHEDSGIRLFGPR